MTEPEQSLFRRLSVFVGGFTIEGAEAVGGARGGERGPLSCAPSDLSVLDGIASLVDKSFLRHLNEGEDEPRFGMLEMIREYGLGRLAEAGEEAATRQCHAAWRLAVAEELWPSFQRRLDAARSINRLAAEHDNLRAALAWLDSTGDGEALLRLTGASFLFWYVHGYLSEGRSWLDRALTYEDETPAAVRARALLGAGMLAHYAADDARATPRLEESLALYRTIADPWGLTFTLTILGIVAEDASDYDRAIARFAESFVYARAADDPVDVGLTLFHLGIVTWGQGDRERAGELLDEALVVQQAAGDLVYGAAESLAFLGLLAGEQGDLSRSVDLQRRSLSLHLEIGYKEVLAVNLANVAMLAVATQRPAVAARLFGAAVGHREGIGNPFKQPERAVYDRAIEAARAVLGDDDFAALDEIGRQATTGASTSRPASSAQGIIRGLTGRELEVLRLLIKGRSDREIAAALFISPRTAQGHVGRIFAKFNVRTRTAAVAAALQAGFDPD